MVAGREAIVLECSHPRAIERTADRPDFHISLAVDRQLGVILRLPPTKRVLATQQMRSRYLDRLLSSTSTAAPS